MIWAGYVTKKLNSTTNYTILDAHIQTHIEWENLRADVPKDNLLQLALNKGILQATCENSGVGFNGTLFELRFYNLTGEGTVRYTESDHGFFAHVTCFDYANTTIDPLKPKLPISKKVESHLMEDLITDFIPLLNNYFQAHPLTLPSTLVPYIPDPIFSLHHQDGCCDGTHGYFSYCF